MIFFSLLILVSNSNEGISSSEKEDFYYLYDSSDSLMLRSESHREIEFLFLRHKGASNGIVFTYYKKSDKKPETVADIASYKVYSYKGFLKLLDQYYAYLGDKSTGENKIFFFPKWVGPKFKNFYVLEKFGKVFYKYPVSLGEAEIDYILE